MQPELRFIFIFIFGRRVAGSLIQIKSCICHQMEQILLFHNLNARFATFTKLSLKGHLIKYETVLFFFLKPHPPSPPRPPTFLIYGAAAQDLLWIFVSVICGIKESTLAFH